MSDAQTRANAAKGLLDDAMLQEAFGEVRNEAIKVWLGTKVLAQQEREIAWLTVKVLDRIEGVLKGAVSDGLIEASRVQAPLR